MTGVAGIDERRAGEGGDVATWQTRSTGARTPADPPTRSAERPSRSGPRASPEPGQHQTRPCDPDELHSLTLRLPRVPSSVPVARHLARHLLASLGMDGPAVDDVEMAVGEAAANAVQHAWHGRAYDVAVTVEGPVCTARVVDDGPGFDPVQVTPSTTDAEGGRGLDLIRAVVDDLLIVSHPSEGTLLRLVKRLR